MKNQNQLYETRLALVNALVRAVYENSTTAVFFHTAVADQAGLGATEAKTLLILRNGPLTAGEIAQKTGLTTPSVTSLIDRLERKDFVERIRDSRDRRRVIVRIKNNRLNDLLQGFAFAHDDFIHVVDTYSDEELTIITDYLERSAEYSRAYLADVTSQLQEEFEKREKREPASV